MGQKKIGQKEKVNKVKSEAREKEMISNECGKQ
jgi:hypothetical protein